MRIVMYLVIVAAMAAAYVSSPDVRLTPAFVKFLPDLLSVGTLVYVVAAGARQQFRYVSFKYWLIFGALAFVMTCGPLINQEQPGPIINGMRYYLRAIPFFFVPAVVDFSEKDIQRYLRLLLGFSLLQCPLAIWQRHETEVANEFTGDAVFGTLMISGILSLFLIAVLSVMGSLMIRGRIGKVWYAFCFLFLVIPMSINETKVTVFLLPLSLLVTFALASPRGRRIPVTLSALGLLIGAGVIFVPLYNYYNTLHNPVPFTVQDFFTNSSMFDTYMNKEARVGTSDEAGRMVSLTTPFKELSRDPIKLAFGLGIGNASQSSVGPQFTGKYQRLYWSFVQELSISLFLFELGVLGTSLILILHFTVLGDALYVAKHDRDSLFGAIAPGYVGAWCTVTIGLFYLTIHNYESLSFMFFFFAGLLAARRLRINELGSRSKATVASSPTSPHGKQAKGYIKGSHSAGRTAPVRR